MKIAPLVIGAVYGQSGDYSDYVAPAASAGEDRWDSWGVENSFNVAVDNSGRAYGTQGSPTAVTCWESNNMGDLKHYTSYTDTPWSNDHHGHDQAADQSHISSDDSDAQVGTWYHLHGNSEPGKDIHSAAAFDNRYSGCIYEKNNWNYSSSTYKWKWKVEYGHNGSAKTNDGIDANTGGDPIRANWWHYFNAHVFAGGSNAVHYIAMANPQYEGLGYLNFIVTFAKSAAFNEGGYNGGNRESKNFNTLPTDILTDNYSAGGSFEFFLGTSENDNEDWYSDYSSGSWTTSNGALSSFPHNDLGKDFRFNVRVLTKLGDGGQSDKDSYYFYKINKIDIDFPYVVRCPKENKHITAVDGSGATFRCMDAANHNGHRSWDNRASNPASSSQTDAEKYNEPTYIEDLSGGTFTNAASTICGSSAVAGGEWYQCGKNYEVKGLMNTYDERAQNEYGTYQEFWFQFHYHFEIDITTTSGNLIAVDGNGSVKPYNFPNILFNAFEVSTVTFTCDHSDLNNANQC